MTVAGMLASISSRELTEWAAYFNLEQLGIAPEQRADLRAGIVAATIANVNRGKGKRAMDPTDFMPFKEEEEQTPDDPAREDAGAGPKRRAT
jgi:hypothetical protein